VKPILIAVTLVLAFDGCAQAASLTPLERQRAAADFHSRAAAHSADSGDQGGPEISEKVTAPRGG
jgi:hypothetical protein